MALTAVCQNHGVLLRIQPRQRSVGTPWVRCAWLEFFDARGLGSDLSDPCGHTATRPAGTAGSRAGEDQAGDRVGRGKRRGTRLSLDAAEHPRGQADDERARAASPKAVSPIAPVGGRGGSLQPSTMSAAEPQLARSPPNTRLSGFPGALRNRYFPRVQPTGAVRADSPPVRGSPANREQQHAPAVGRQRSVRWTVTVPHGPSPARAAGQTDKRPIASGHLRGVITGADAPRAR